MSNSQRLLRTVGLRKRLVAAARSAYVWVLILAGAYALLFVVARLLSLVPVDWVSWMTFLLVPALALLAAGILHRRPSERDAARLVDSRMGTKDLFLTRVLIDTAPGGYKPLVVEDAEQKAPGIRPQTVVPFEPWHKAGHATLALAALLALSLTNFSFDPFGVHEEAKQRQEQLEQLKKQKEQTVLRANQLKRKNLQAKRSEAVEKALKEMQLNFNKMKPKDKAGNFRRLSVQQRNLEDLYRKANEKKQQQFRKAMQQRSGPQRLGKTGSRQKSQQWKDQIKAGKTEGLKKELDELKDLAKQLAQTKDPAKQQQLRQEMEQRLKDLADFANSQVGSPQLQAALTQALQQLDSSSMRGLSSQSLDALQQSLSLSQAELDSLAQSLRDLQALNQAMQTLQQAKQLNQLQPLDGKQCQACQNMGQYAQFYSQCLAQCRGVGIGGWQPGQTPSTAPGGGMGGPGRGRGGVAPEDSSVPTNFKTEKSRTYISRGKILLQIKTKEVADRGQMAKDYRDAIRQLKVEAAEAVNAEQVPPGYHDMIGKYFSNVDDTVEPPEAPEAPEE